MAYPTTLALIAALWTGPGRTKSIALWSALGGAIASLGPLVAGALLESFDWGSVFLITLPLVVVAFPMALKLVPSHVNEAHRAGRQPRRHPLGRAGRGADPRDQLRRRCPNKGALAARAGGDRGGRAGRVLHPPAPRRATRCTTCTSPRAGSSGSRPCAGIIVFGSLMGAAFISQQFLQNVLGYSTLEAGAAFLPTIVFMVLVAPRSAKLVEARGARFTLLCGYASLLLAFATMLLLWEPGAPVLEDRPRLRVHRDRRRLRRHARLALADRLGAGPARRHGVRHRRPPARPRRRDHAVDLRRAADRRLRGRRRGGDRRRAEQRSRSPTASRAS